MQLTKDRQFTVTTYVLYEGKTLLIWHPKFNKWMPPGGHLEENETPPEGALREVLEETGLIVEFIPDEHLHINASHAVSLARPYFCLLEQVPAFGDKPAHEHIDLIFLARPLNLNKQNDPAHPTRWFSWEEIEQLNKNEIFEDAFQILKCIMRK
jgi:ADP-ribose pyrophosphatase YjhB (NUDIX family)